MDEFLYNFYHYLFYNILSINHVPACVSLSVVNVSYATLNCSKMCSLVATNWYNV